MAGDEGEEIKIIPARLYDLSHRGVKDRCAIRDDFLGANAIAVLSGDLLSGVYHLRCCATT